MCRPWRKGYAAAMAGKVITRTVMPARCYPQEQSAVKKGCCRRNIPFLHAGPERRLVRNFPGLGAGAGETPPLVHRISPDKNLLSKKERRRR